MNVHTSSTGDDAHTMKNGIGDKAPSVEVGCIQVYVMGGARGGVSYRMSTVQSLPYIGVNKVGPHQW